ncbi:hypothetical protein OAO42_01240 [Candidatus Izimaplasma bacterium]|nr:hypothetical protein [Candidatus Izimaplasma bacterium]
MIDMHSHILFGVDDGCKTIDDSIRMINKAVSVGVTNIILTPHYAPLRGYVEPNEIVHENYKQLQDRVHELSIPINLYLGREIDKTDGIENLLRKGLVNTINNTNYVLVDFGMEKSDIDEYCYELVIAGYIPIIAHPERYNYIDDLSLYRKWKKTGALIQINASSLVHTKSKNAKKVAKHLLSKGLVDLVGSDVHSNEASYDYFLKATKVIGNKNMSEFNINCNKLIKGGNYNEKL